MRPDEVVIFNNPAARSLVLASYHAEARYMRVYELRSPYVHNNDIDPRYGR